MKWILLFFVFVSFIPFDSHAAVVDKETAKYECFIRDNMSTYINDKNQCLSLAYSNTLYSCNKAPYFSGHNVICPALNPATGAQSGYPVGGIYDNVDNVKICPSSHPHETPDGRCTDLDNSMKCSDSSTQKQFQNEQYSCQLSNPNTSLYDTVFKWSCIDNDGADADLGVYCEYPENGCIQGLNCSPKDTQVCDPTSTDCELPAMTQAEDMPNYVPEIPLENPDFCTLNPDLCSEPDLALTPEPNQNPSLSDTPNVAEWTDYENKTNAQNELNSKHLENINHNIKNLSDNMIKQSKFNNKLGQNQLGALFAIGESSDEGETPNSASADCSSQSFSCDGDVIQCTLLKQVYENNCVTDELSDFESSLNTITNVDNVAALVQEDTIDLGEIDEKYLNDGVAASGTCPTDKTLSITIFNKTASVTIPYGPLCDLVTGVAPAVIIMGWFMGIVIIGRGQIGGF